MDGKHIVETEKCAGAKPVAMSEERRFTILFAATLLAARKLIPMMEEDRPNMAKDYWTEIYAKKAIDGAAFILERIDRHWPPKAVAARV